MSESEVNPQITDAVNQVNTAVVGSAPNVALASLALSISHSLSLAAANAVFAQQQSNITYQAATAAGLSKLVAGGAGTVIAREKTDPTSLTPERLEQHIADLREQIDAALAVKKSVANPPPVKESSKKGAKATQRSARRA